MAEIPVGDRLQADHDNMFVDSGDGKVYRRVKITTGTDGSLLAGVTFDRIDASYPSASVEVYEYSLSAVLQATITVTYQDATKELITSVVRT